MYNNQSYDDYIRSILGYPMQNDNIYQADTYFERQGTQYRVQNNQELENLYPEIYKIIYPMIRKACISNNMPINGETIENIVDDIYSSVESDNVYNININLQNETTSSQDRSNQNTNSSSQTSSGNKGIQKVLNRNEGKAENRGENRQFRNKSLRDLIKILLIRELLGSGRPNQPVFRITAY